ncbi:denitrification system component NirT/cytochrome c552 [Sulfuritalea hydrogenivorans sk43H]|uniref:Denitrification system component NirT/cytochrome c552 n=2 Tax=Sulfuritalea hydrogenivorans TaxID=748811 RepID=W0SCX5_9PROT|nr:denitrification system component NirT/cytochrome c552 [Sulfuritalea hydrogenivorans sk43H]
MFRMIVIGVLGGIGIWGLLNTGVEYTNRTEFCLSCHTMQTPFEELKKTVHYSNRTGTSVGCADCHVASSKEPFDYARKLTQKVFASKDVIGQILGTIDTPEKFEAYRLTMAKRVWAHMKETDSKECRNCHKFDKMDTTKQKDRSAVKHEGAVQDGKTCIDCHKGIAHKPVHHLLEGGPAPAGAAAAGTAAPAQAEAPTAPKVEAAAAPVTAPSAPAAAPATATAVAAAPTQPAKATPKAEPAGAAAPAASAITALDWSKVPARQVKVFYPGQAGLEWVMNKADHSSAADIIEKKRACAKCHEGDANEVGAAIVAGKPVGVSKTVMEPNPPAGKVGFIPVTFQTTHDGNKIYFRFEWVPPKNGDKKMDPKNEVKLTMMFDGGGTVEGSEINGCWATCHVDLRTMKDAKDDKKTKYIKDADLAGGKFMDLIQFRSGKGLGPVDGWVDSERHMDGGKSQLKAEGKKEGNKWIVTFERTLAGGGKGNHAITADKVYNFGFAIHEDFTNARYHYVSLGYQFGLDKPNPGVKNYIDVQKQ